MAVRPAFLQVLLSRRVVRRAEAERLHAAVARAMDQASSFEQDIEAANADLARISLEIRACNDPKTGEAFLLLVNTKGDALAEVATPYSAVELVYIKSVVRHLPNPDRGDRHRARRALRHSLHRRAAARAAGAAHEARRVRLAPEPRAAQLAAALADDGALYPDATCAE